MLVTVNNFVDLIRDFGLTIHIELLMLLSMGYFSALGSLLASVKSTQCIWCELANIYIFHKDFGIKLHELGWKSD